MNDPLRRHRSAAVGVYPVLRSEVDDLNTTMIYTHVMRRPAVTVQSPLDRLVN